MKGEDEIEAEFNTVGVQIKKTRELRHMTQIAAAMLLGDAPQPSLSRWETGDEFPDVGYWEAIGEFIGVDAEQIGILIACDKLGRHQAKRSQDSPPVR